MYITNITDGNDTNILDDDKKDCDLDTILPFSYFQFRLDYNFCV